MKIEDLRPTGKRKKLHEIKGHYHCSIVGTCISLKELEKIKRKAGVKIPANSSEHEIHGIFVYLAGENELPSKFMTKLLDKKYAKEIRELSKLKTDEEINKKWKEELEKGNIPGPYWALMSNPYSSTKTLSDAFGEVHMLSHMIGRSNRADIQRVKRLEEEKDKLGSKIKAFKKIYTNRYKEIHKKLNLETKKTNQLFSLLDEAEHEIKELKDKLKSSTFKSFNSDSATEEIKDLNNSVEFLKNENYTLYDKIDEYKEQIEQLRLKNQALEAAVAFKENQIPEEKCLGCTSQNCPGPDLCGKTILYVGGRKNVLPRYKEIVEKHGGEFLYHDGGMESSKKSIDNAVLSADMVFCPIDCTSHDACLRLKKICKKTDKSFIPLKSSGASSFMRYIETIN